MILKKEKEKKIRYFFAAFLPFILILLLVGFFSSSCRIYMLKKKLDPVNAEFLSKVRYIITKKEKKIFLESADSEKEGLRKEFWRRRDPDPSTEENEFKMEYFNRIEKANELFISEGKPGWLTDRGRIYILFGPPMDRIISPMEDDPYIRCRETWYYGNFPVVFADYTCTGDYRLVTYDLTAIRSINLMYMHELSRAQELAQQTIREEERGFFDFNLSLEKTLVEKKKVEGLIAIAVPYSNLWFAAAEEKLETILDLELEIKDFEGNLIWEYEGSHKIQTEEDELKKNMEREYMIKIPFIIDENVEKLRQGKCTLHAFLKNRAGEEEMRKVIEFIL